MLTTRRRSACDVTVAVQSAQAYLVKLIGGAEDVRLEEVERSDRTNVWRITLSHTIAGQNLVLGRQLRHYREFRISAGGEATAMKIRFV